MPKSSNLEPKVALTGGPLLSVPLTVVWPLIPETSAIDFNAGDEVEERKLIIIPGLNALRMVRLP